MTDAVPSLSKTSIDPTGRAALGPTTVMLPPVGRRSEDSVTTPTGLQSRQQLTMRRMIMLALNAVTVAILAAGIMQIFGSDGWSATDISIIVCFLIGAPWTVMGMWNALVGFWLLHGRRDGLAVTAPHLAAGDSEAPVSSRVAVAMTLRNEDAERALDRLVETKRSLNATGFGDLFHVFVLSDSSEPEAIQAEERAFHKRRTALGGMNAQYRRRDVNTGFKAGNVRDFLNTHGRDYSLYLPLDSDSLMSGETIVKMTRMMEAHPRIGILQSLVVGTPATSLFARIFQFGMRHGMRSFTMGAAWWQGDCGPYWGHNALIRVAPFRRFCRLPTLPGKAPLGGHVLSHDQVEAVMMRRAGYEVRVIPTEGESWEDNPPTLMDFTKRDLRWCQGNMQYFRLLGMKDLRPTSRFQVFAAIMMYLGAPAWMLMTLAAAFKVVEGMPEDMNAALAISMFFAMFTVSLVPKMLGLLDIVLTPGGVARYGGSLRFAASGFVEAVFSILLAPVVAFRVTLFLIGLAMGKSVTWNGQNRDAYMLTWTDAARGLWPQTLFGFALGAFILIGSGWGTILWASPMLLGLTLSIPLAVMTAHPIAGQLGQRIGLCAIPDEIVTPESLRRLGQPERGSPPPKAAAA